MKFLTKINHNFFLWLIPIMLVISLAGYFLLHAVILNEAKEVLLNKEILIKKQIKDSGQLPNIYPILIVKRIDHISNKESKFQEISIYNDFENELEPYIEYSNQVAINGLCYSIQIRQSVFENEDLAIILALVLFILLFSAFVISFIISKKMNKTVWLEFEHSLSEIENYSFTKGNNLNLLESDIEEFDRLNKIVNQLTEKLTSDYISLKEFTENASHEIQTPISIVLLNLEEILQQELPQEVFQKIAASITALKRLSTLNQSLILLTKIDNKQFKSSNFISLKDVINRKLQEFEMLFESKNINLDFQTKQDFKLEMNEQLSDLLINNLLSNAVNHNIQSGKIQIEIHENELRICNTGENNSFTEETIFNRFTKGNSKSLGLGLAIVKKICDTHNLEIHYHNDDLHCFTIHLKS